MNLDLKNKVFYIGGSSRGIGLAIAATLLEEGARVVITGRNQEALDSAMASLTVASDRGDVLALCGDLADSIHTKTSLQRSMSQWGRLDGVVANVGTGTDFSGWNIPDEEWKRVFSLNFSSSQSLAQNAVPLLSQSGGGSIVFISSLAGLEDIGAPATYTAAKSAIITLSKSLSRSLGPMGIRVNSVAPGNVLFPGGRWEKKLEMKKDETMGMIHREVPMRRFGTPAEIANAVVFLLSGRASFVTGACLAVDGGQSHTI